jgi:hypothetical protein
MARVYSRETTGVLDGTVPPLKADGRLYAAKKRIHRASIDLAARTYASGDVIVLGKLPQGARFAGGRITSSVSLGSATVAIGNDTTAGKYRAAATFTAPDTPTAFGTAAGLAQDPLVAEETIVATIAAAALPASGTLVIDIEYTTTAS